MRALYLILLSSMLLLSGCNNRYEMSFAGGRETDVFIPSGNSYCSATLNYPAEVDDNLPVVIFLPGFLGERDELPVAGTSNERSGGLKKGIFELAAERFSEEGIISLRIDYRNFGKSPGLTEDALMTNQVEDIENSIGWVRTHFKTDKIALCGFSLGGALAAVASGKYDLDSLILWSSPDRVDDLINIVPEREREILETDGIASFHTPWNEEVTLKKGFFDSALAFDPLSSIAGNASPLFISIGLGDKMLKQPDAGLSYYKANPGNSELMITSSGHSLNSEYNEYFAISIISRTLHWLREQHGVAKPDNEIGSLNGNWKLVEYLNGGLPSDLSMIDSRLEGHLDLFFSFSGREMKTLYKITDSNIGEFSGSFDNGLYSYNGSVSYSAEKSNVLKLEDDPANDAELIFCFYNDKLILNLQSISGALECSSETFVCERIDDLDLREASEGKQISELFRAF